MKLLITLILSLSMSRAAAVDVVFPDRESIILAELNGVELDVYLGAFARGYLDEMTGKGGGNPLYNGEFGNFRTRGYGHGIVYAVLIKQTSGDLVKFRELSAEFDKKLHETGK